MGIELGAVKKAVACVVAKKLTALTAQGQHEYNSLRAINTKLGKKALR